MALHPAAFAVLVVLAGSVQTDWELRYSDGHRECVRTPPPQMHQTAEALCQEALRAILAGKLISLGGTPTGCHPSPGCFSAREDCIVGYVGPRKEGYCK